LPGSEEGVVPVTAAEAVRTVAAVERQADHVGPDPAVTTSCG
jgi:hypothetical protein